MHHCALKTTWQNLKPVILACFLTGANNRARGRAYTSYRVAKQLPIEFSTTLLRSQLRPNYGDGFLGAPLRANALSFSPPRLEQGDRRGLSRTPTIPDTGDLRDV
jgi:hypothetical protein